MTRPIIRWLKVNRIFLKTYSKTVFPDQSLNSFNLIDPQPEDDYDSSSSEDEDLTLKLAELSNNTQIKDKNTGSLEE